MKALPLLFLILISTLQLSACDRKADIEEPEEKWIVLEQADSFLKFINTQASLGAGSYKLVISPIEDSTSGSYNIQVSINNTNTFVSGTWENAEGMSSSDTNNPVETITLSSAGGITTTTTASTETYLYLFKNDSLIAEGTEIDLPVSQINAQSYTDAYYKAVDPKGERKTLKAWKQKNGFDISEDAHVIFRDTKDLGYGRNMHARKNNDTGVISFFVKNFAANLGGSDGQYGPANLAAAIAEMKEYHIGTNAIEFSPIYQDASEPNTGAPDPDSEKILKFFTFRSSSNIAGATEHRMDTVDLDGRGSKQMPIPCLVCHGARLLPLDENGDFQLLSLRTAKLNQLELDSFQFADSGTFSKSELESGIKIINQYVNDVYEGIGNHDPSNPNHWDSSFALELSEGRYGGEGFPEDSYQTDFIPNGWKQNDDRPEGVELLFTEVIQPHCVSCHSIRGKTAAEVAIVNVNDINFSTYEKFISYNDKLIDYVYKRGIMPLSLLNYNKFWEEPEGAPSLLASFLTDFDVYDENNLVIEPGLPFAKPGENRSAHSPVKLNASASYFAAAYSWNITSQPTGSAAQFDESDTSNPTFTTDTNGQYVLTLTVSNNLGSNAADLTLTIDDTANSLISKNQTNLTFVDDIMDDILGSNSNDPNACTNCHKQESSRPGIPVFYNLYNGDEINKNLYLDFRARINLADPENSLVLRKPTNNHHGGGLRIDRKTLAGEEKYQTLLNWIREGAVCGTMTDICD